MCCVYGIFLRGLEDPGFLSAICSRWGGQVCIHVQSMWLTKGVRGHALLGNFDFGPFIRRNLVESGTVFEQT